MPDGLRHVDLLLQKYRPGMSVADIERQAGLKPGLLAQHLKPTREGRAPGLDVLTRFCDALDAPMWDVSQAFFADAGVSMGSGPPHSAQAERFLTVYLGLSPARQRLAEQLVQVLADDDAHEKRGTQ